MDTLGFSHTGYAIETDLALRLEAFEALLNLSKHIGHRDRPH